MRHQGQPGVAVGLFGVVGDEAGRGQRDVVEDLRPLPAVRPAAPAPAWRGAGRCRPPTGRARRACGKPAPACRADPPRRTSASSSAAAHRPCPRRTAPPPRPRVRRIAWPWPMDACAQASMVCSMARVRGRVSLAGAGLGELHQVQRVVGTAQMDHLAGGAGERLAGARPVAALARRMGGDDEVLLGGGLQADVVGHPAGEDGEVGGDAPQPPLEMVGVAVGEHAAHLVELAHHGLALEPAAAGGVPGAEHLDRALQRLDLLRPDGGRLVAVEARRGRRAVGCVESWGRRPPRAGSVCSQSCMALLSAEPAASAAPAPTKPRRLSMRSIPVNSVRTAAVRSGAHGRPSGCPRPDVLPLPRTPVPCRTRGPRWSRHGRVAR